MVTLQSMSAGEKIEENRSRFLACGGPCGSADCVDATLDGLVRAYRLGKASQLSWAARFRAPDGRLIELREDGSESGAAACILAAMQAVEAEGCLVLVARWYGGRHLGGMRFRIYRKLASALLADGASTPPESR
ncbi:MAG TPA: YigZ family protein [Candidatus Fermentibacter daniensis]|nr:MAG: hypothetical protein BWX47_00949 [candidate division Hyd24-12 bacterium ADurb.Bin004]HOZ16924.1 YigZ family protein [Candidatus Fermentibacter daniensis]HPH38663.1 YigZ family protein [Candidatus Fermentibacter daniensis]HPN61868.1 YigZ family protein [Candidatus Fermentibacter daniensis]